MVVGLACNIHASATWVLFPKSHLAYTLIRKTHARFDVVLRERDKACSPCSKCFVSI